jgi:transcription termination/antitermination protein NusG
MTDEALQNESIEEAPPLPTSGDWFVLHTRSRQEKLVVADLTAQGIGVFLPLLTQVRYYGRRKLMSEKPMFPGYVFLRGAREQTYLADRTKRVANIITVADQQQLDWELRNIHLAITRQAPLDPYPYLQEGVRVEVRAGPFRGLQGIVEKRGQANRLLLQVDMLGRAMSVEIDGSLLEPI